MFKGISEVQFPVKFISDFGGFHMRLTTRTSLAMKTLMFCAVNSDRLVRRNEIAACSDASENHLAQVIHLLGLKGYLRTQRGRAGGLELARLPREITVGQVFRDFEAVLPFSDCIGQENGKCPLAGACRLTCVMTEALDAFYARLDQTTLADLVEGNSPLTKILQAA